MRHSDRLRHAWLLIIAIGTMSITEAGEVTAERVRTALPQLESLAERTLERTGVPGMAIAVVYRDQVVYLKGFGIREAGQSAPVDGDTVFQLASVSKPMASTVVAALVGNEIVEWDDRLVDLDPHFALSDPWTTREVTIRDMLCHRSGLPDHGGDLLEDLGYNREDILHRLRFLKPSGRFRADYAYTNFGYTAAAVAAARAAESSWEELCDETLYRPLGMRSTSSRHEDFVSAENRARLHVQVDGRWTARHDRQPDAQSPAGGVSSSASDMAKWLRLQLDEGKFEGRQLVAAEALAETHRPQIVSRPPASSTTDRAGFYGLGWNVSYDDDGRVRLGHSGGFDLGAATVVALLPSEELGIVVLTNAAPRGVPESISESFFDLVTHGRIERDWGDFFEQLMASALAPAYGTGRNYTESPAQVSPPLPPATYVGDYHNTCFGDLRIVESEGSFVLELGPQNTRFPLRHWNRDSFLYQPVGESAGGPSAVTFTIDADRRATNVVIENLDIHGQGTFTRSHSAK